MEYQKNEKKINNKKYTFIVTIGVILIILSFFYIGYKYYFDIQSEKLEEENINNFFDVDASEEEVIEEEKENELKVQEQRKTINYVGIIEIPKINLKKGLVNKNSKNNNVDKTIMTLKETTYPDDNSISHIILASHSGNCSVCYFKNLYKLNINDDVYFYYKGNKYIYNISNKYEIDKTGKMEYKYANNSNIVLITCIRGTNKQIVYIADLINNEKY